MDEKINILVKRIKDGNEDAFAEFYRLTVKFVYSVVYAYLLSKEDTEDVVQDTYLKIYTIRKRLNSKQSVILYMKKIAINYAFKKLRHRNKTIKITESEYPVESDKDEIILKAMKKLDDKERMIIALHYLSNSSIKEISFLLRENESTVKTQLFRARNKLKEVIKNELL